MKKTSKALLLMLCAVLLVAASVLGTMAYLTSTDTVTNTFTVGKVAITLDEALVDTNGHATTGNRVKANAYHLLPGHEYDKDPTVHVEADSENCYLFVKVENGISAFEATANPIASQITANGWTALTDVTGVYYKEHTKATTATDYVVFKNFKIADNAQSVSGWGSASNAKITVTAYAIQKDGFATAAAAWTASGFSNA